MICGNVQFTRDYILKKIQKEYCRQLNIEIRSQLAYNRQREISMKDKKMGKAANGAAFPGDKIIYLFVGFKI